MDYCFIFAVEINKPNRFLMKNLTIIITLIFTIMASCSCKAQAGETVKLKGNPFHTEGKMVKVGSDAPNFSAVKSDLSEAQLVDFKGKRVILNIFPSLDTPVCAVSVRHFNELASSLENTVVLCLSVDLPFAHSRFCTTEGIENVIPLSLFRSDDFAKSYGLKIADGPMKGLMARSVVVLDENGKVIYTELVDEITSEPNYDAAISALK